MAGCVFLLPPPAGVGGGGPPPAARTRRGGGGGEGTSIVSYSVLADGRAPHPNPLPARAGRGRGRRQRTQKSAIEVAAQARARRMIPDKPIGVAGAGSIGCFVGGMYAAAGPRAALLARAREIDGIEANGSR